MSARKAPSKGTVSKRSFLANRQDENLVPGAPPEEDDIPLLTEVVPDEALPAIANEPDAPPVSAVPPLEELAQQMIQAIQEQMTYELPTLVEAALLSASEELRRGIASTMEAALRDFVARR